MRAPLSQPTVVVAALGHPPWPVLGAWFAIGPTEKAQNFARRFRSKHMLLEWSSATLATLRLAAAEALRRRALNAVLDAHVG